MGQFLCFITVAIVAFIVVRERCLYSLFFLIKIIDILKMTLLFFYVVVVLFNKTHNWIGCYF